LSALEWILSVADVAVVAFVDGFGVRPLLSHAKYGSQTLASSRVGRLRGQFRKITWLASGLHQTILKNPMGIPIPTPLTLLGI
jgi:hypothetical protein